MLASTQRVLIDFSFNVMITFIQSLKNIHSVTAYDIFGCFSRLLGSRRYLQILIDFVWFFSLRFCRLFVFKDPDALLLAGLEGAATSVSSYEQLRGDPLPPH